jgi:toxin ParE1/3/4
LPSPPAVDAAWRDYRLSDLAKADIATILRTSEKRHGAKGRTRYRALLTAAMRRIAVDPAGIATSDRSDLHAGVRSFHIRNSRAESREAPVANPVHVIFFRLAAPGIIEIVRVLHERMEPSRRVGGEGQ